MSKPDAEDDGDDEVYSDDNFAESPPITQKAKKVEDSSLNVKPPVTVVNEYGKEDETNTPVI